MCYINNQKGPWYDNLKVYLASNIIFELSGKNQNF